MTLYLIYDFQASYSTDYEFHPANYKVLYVFDEKEFINKELLVELAKSVPEGSHFDLTFNSLDDLKLFLLRILDELEATTAFLISAQNYNIGLDSLKTKDQFFGIFPTYGESIYRDEKASKKGLLGKIFT